MTRRYASVRVWLSTSRTVCLGSWRNPRSQFDSSDLCAPGVRLVAAGGGSVSDLWPQVEAQCPTCGRIRGLGSAVCSQASVKYPACALSRWDPVCRSVIETSSGKGLLVLPFRCRGAYSWRQPNGDALVAQWIEHLTTDQKVGGSSPFERAAAPLGAIHRWGFCVFLGIRSPTVAPQLNPPSTSTGVGRH